MIRLFTLIMISLGFFLSQASVAQNLQVVTSIQPLQLIANQVMQGSGQAQVLIEPDATIDRSVNCIGDNAQAVSWVNSAIGAS